MQFEYSALNNENKKLSGIINADTEEGARTELNNLGLAILSLTEAHKETPDASEKLKFEGLDKKGKKIVGTIPETDYKKAYIRLTEEYGFMVTALFPLNATEDEIRNSLHTVSELKADYELEKANASAPNILSKEEQDAKEKLQTEVNFVIQKIESIMNIAGENIKGPEQKEILQMKDRLIRLKNSNNLNYIKLTCEELLKKVQDKEIYLRQDAFVQEREKIKLETQKMLFEVNRINTDPSRNLFHEKPKTRHSMEQVPDENKQRIKEIYNELYDYIRIYLKSDSAIRPEVLMKIKELWAEKKSIQQKQKEAHIVSKAKEATPPHLEKEIRHISGMLLACYLTYYMIRYYISMKNHFLSSVPERAMELYTQPIFSYIILSTFFIHIALQIRKFHFPESKIYNMITYPSLFLLLIFLNLNF